MSEGKTKEEALKNINDAIMLYLQDIEKEAKEKKAIALEVQV
jgi:predicted RNase H-like HicB family nuclease